MCANLARRNVHPARTLAECASIPLRDAPHVHEVSRRIIANSFSIKKEQFHVEAGSYVNNARLTGRRFALLQRQWLLRGAPVFSVSQIGVTL